VKRIAAIAGVWLLAAAPPPVLTFGDAIARVMSAGYDVRIQAAASAVAAADARAQTAAYRPQASLSLIGSDSNLPQLGMPVARQTYAQMTASVPLFSPGARASERSVTAATAAAGADLDVVRGDSALAAARAYRRAQLGVAVAELRETAVEDQREHVRTVSERVAVGKAPRYLLARDRAALAAAEQAAEDARAERDESLVDLLALLALPVDGDVQGLEILAPVAFSSSREAVLAHALASRPEIEVTRHRRELAEAALSGAAVAYAPSLSLGEQTYSGASTPPLGRGGSQTMLTVSLPILDGGARSAALARARSEVERAKLLDAQARANVARDVINAWRELDAAQRNLATAEAGRIDAEEQLRVARLRESAGKAIELEVLDALAVAAAARETVARSIARYDTAIAVVHRAAADPQT
jgi:outer membrane protein TolC